MLIWFFWAQRISTPSLPHWLIDFGGWRAGRVGPPGTMGTQQLSSGLRRLETEPEEVSEGLGTKVYRWDDVNFYGPVHKPPIRSMPYLCQLPIGACRLLLQGLSHVLLQLLTFSTP